MPTSESDELRLADCKDTLIKAELGLPVTSHKIPSKDDGVSDYDSDGGGSSGKDSEYDDVMEISENGGGGGGGGGGGDNDSCSNSCRHHDEGVYFPHKEYSTGKTAPVVPAIGPLLALSACPYRICVWDICHGKMLHLIRLDAEFDHTVQHHVYWCYLIPDRTPARKSNDQFFIVSAIDTLVVVWSLDLAAGEHNLVSLLEQQLGSYGTDKITGQPPCPQQIFSCDFNYLALPSVCRNETGGSASAADNDNAISGGITIFSVNDAYGDLDSDTCHRRLLSSGSGRVTHTLFSPAEPESLLTIQDGNLCSWWLGDSPDSCRMLWSSGIATGSDASEYALAWNNTNLESIVLVPHQLQAGYNLIVLNAKIGQLQMQIDPMGTLEDSALMQTGWGQYIYSHVSTESNFSVSGFCIAKKVRQCLSKTGLELKLAPKMERDKNKARERNRESVCVCVRVRE